MATLPTAKAQAEKSAISSPITTGSPTDGRGKLPSWFSLSVQADVDVLLHGKGGQFVQTFLAADAHILDAAESGAEKMLRDLVDPDEASLYAHRGAVHLADFARAISSR